jgi:hypothetical protein
MCAAHMPTPQPAQEEIVDLNYFRYSDCDVC